MPWLVQGATTVALLVARPGAVPGWLVAVDAVLAAGPVAITALVAVPLHRRLRDGLDQKLVSALLRANLVRTVAWTAGVVTAGAMVILTR